jgi:hypothetical protein
MMRNASAWRVNLGTRVIIAVLAALMYGFAILVFCIPLLAEVHDHSGDWITDLLGIALLGFAFFATFALVAVVRTRVGIDAAGLEATVIAGHGWLLVPRFRHVRVPLAEIHSVERRQELFRTLGFPTMREALSVVTAGGEQIGLFSDTLGSASTLPLDEIASAIAVAAGVPVTDDGIVRTRGSGLYGAASSSWTERPLDAESATKAQRAVVRTLQISTIVLASVFLLRACL